MHFEPNPEAIPPRGAARRTRRGLAIIEMLVAILIIVMLISLIVPSLLHARSVARRTSCMNNLKQLTIAMQNYESQYGIFPPGYVYAPGKYGENLSGFGWCAVMLPYLDHGPLAEQIDWSQPIGAPAHDTLRTVHLSVMRCPAESNDGGPIISLDVAFAPANYAGSFGPADMRNDPEDRQGMFSRNSATRASDVSDGMAHTLLMGERIGGTFLDARNADTVQCITTWAGTGPSPNDPGREAAEFVLFRAANRPGSRERDAQDASSAHPESSCFGMADGAVRVMSSNVDLGVYQALSTRSGGEMEGRLPPPK